MLLYVVQFMQPSLIRPNFPLLLLNPQTHKDSVIRTPTMQIKKIPADTAEIMMVTSLSS